MKIKTSLAMTNLVSIRDSLKEFFKVFNLKKKNLQAWIYWITPSYLIGLIIGFNYKFSLSLLLIILTIFLLILISYSIHRTKFIKYLVVALFFLIGILVVTLAINRMSNSILLKFSGENSDVTLKGTVCSRPMFFKNSVSFFLDAKYLEFEGNNWKVNERTQITIFFDKYKNNLNENSKILEKSNLKNDLENTIFLGQGITILGKLNKIEIKDSIKFSWEKYLYNKRIQTKFITNTNKILRTSTPLLARIRKYITGKAKAIFKKYVNHEYAPFLIGTILGDRSEILPETTDHFTKSGLLHILAISGANMVVIASSIMFISKLIRLSFFKKILIIIVIILSYTYLVGYEASIIRASIITILTMLALILGRKRDSVALLLTSGLLITLHDPFSIYDIGFQLSFLSVAGILLISPIIDELFGDKSNFLTNTFSITFSVLLVIAPITLYHFKQFSIISILSNFLALPVSSLIMSLGMFCVWLSLLFEKMIYPFLWVLDKTTSYLFFISKVSSKIPYGQLYFSRFSIHLVFLYYLFLSFTVGFLTKNNINKKSNKKLIICLIIFLTVLVLAYQVFLHLPPKNLSLTFFDVDNGDSCLIRTPEGINILIDGGPEGKDIVKKLHLRGIKKLDLVILSHPHSDHIDGLIEVLNEIPINSVLIGNLDLSESDQSVIEKHNLFLEIVNTKQIPLFIVKSKNIMRISSKLNLIPIWPEPDDIIYLKENINNQSLVLLLEYEYKKILFTGDIEIQAQIEILNSYRNLSTNKLDDLKNSFMNKSSSLKDLSMSKSNSLKDIPINSEVYNSTNNCLLKADILKVPHQGSKDANFFKFLKAVSPKIAVISVGLNNKYNHPSEETINSLKKIKSIILRTDKLGDIDIIVKNNYCKILTERYYNY